MKVALLGTNDPSLDRYPPGGGVEWQIWFLAQFLARKGHDVHILTRYRGKQEEQLDSITLHGVGPPSVPGMAGSLEFSRNAAKLIRRLKPDVVYLAEKLTSYLVSKTDIPMVYYTHNKDTFRDYRTHMRTNPLKLALGRMIEDRVMARCETICCPTDEYQRELAERGFDNTVVIPPGIEIDDYTNLGDQGFVLSSGQLHKVKGIRYLLESFAALHPHFSAYDLLIGGDGPERDSLEKEARKLSIAEHVRFRPRCSREELLQEFGTCSVYVLPSLSESFGIVTLEAMASGKPVVASDISGPRSVIRHGNEGFLFDPGNSQELAGFLEQLLEDPDLRTRMGAAGRKRVAECFDINEICENMERVLVGVS